MSHRTRVILVVAVALAAAAGVAGGAALFGGDDEPEAARPEGNPPVLVDLGVRTDPEAARLRRAAGKHSHGDFAGARAEFAGGRSLQAEAGEAISAWPDGTLERLEELATLHPGAAPCCFHLGLARFWSGDTAGAQSRRGGRRARGRPTPRSPFGRADLLFRGAPPGLPTFVPGFRGPREVRAMEAPEQFAALQRMARRADPRAKLLYGVALQRVERPVSARREFSAAAKLAPNDADALVADAIGRFDKEHPERAFSRMGPLTRRFPRAGTVRFHLGLMLLWLGDLEEARRQLGRATRLGPPHDMEAKRLLDRLEGIRES